jgi:hypothetical protein
LRHRRRNGRGSALVRIDQKLQLVEAHQREAAERGSQNALEARVIFDDEAAAVEVQAGAFDVLLCLQPSKRRLGELSLAAQ